MQTSRLNGPNRSRWKNDVVVDAYPHSTHACFVASFIHRCSTANRRHDSGHISLEARRARADARAHRKGVEHGAHQSCARGWGWLRCKLALGNGTRERSLERHLEVA